MQTSNYFHFYATLISSRWPRVSFQTTFLEFRFQNVTTVGGRDAMQEKLFNMKEFILKFVMLQCLNFVKM